MHLKGKELTKVADRLNATSNALRLVADAFDLANARLEKLRVALNKMNKLQGMTEEVTDILEELNSDWREEQEEVEQALRAENKY